MKISLKDKTALFTGRTRCIGRSISIALARWKKVEEYFEQTLKEKNVWFACLDEILVYLDYITKSSTYKHRTEYLLYFKRPILK